MEDLKINGSFFLLISNSNEPSKTMRINPIVPKIGKIGFKFGTVIFNLLVINFTPKPKSNNKINEGIFVLEAEMSKTYANKSKTESVIMIGIVIC